MGKISGGTIIEGSIPVGAITATGNIGPYLIELVTATGGAITRTLPAVASSKYHEFTIIKVDSSANAVTIEGNGAETINGAANIELSAQYESVKVACDGTSWYIV